MNPELPTEVQVFAQSTRQAFGALGGTEAARRAEQDPATRAQVADALAALGVTDLDPLADAVAGSAAAVLCQAAGRVSLPYPVESTLLRGAGEPFAVVGGVELRVDHGDLFAHWAVATPDGRGATAAGGASRLGTRLGPFVSDVVLDAPFPKPTAAAPRDLARVAWWLTLRSWRILGALEEAVALAVGHTSERIQFGKPLTAFQTVRFQLADASVAVAGLRELAHFTLWRLHAAPTEALTDALALRCYALDAARAVLRTTQQLHGAAGLCDEYAISIVVRHLQPALRLPEGGDAVARRLAGAVEHSGFAGLFPHGRATRTGGSASTKRSEDHARLAATH